MPCDYKVKEKKYNSGLGKSILDAKKDSSKLKNKLEETQKQAKKGKIKY